MNLAHRRRYAERVLDLYRCTPGASGFARRADRGLAAALFDRQVPLETVHAALLLAVARRARRPSNAKPLAAIASLHYFLPIIEELIAAPPDPAYLQYIRQSLTHLAPALVAASDHQFP
jgi:hypothetical protein